MGILNTVSLSLLLSLMLLVLFVIVVAMSDWEISLTRVLLSRVGSTDEVDVGVWELRSSDGILRVN